MVDRISAFGIQSNLLCTKNRTSFTTILSSDVHVDCSISGCAAAAGLVEEGAAADTDAVTTEFDDVLTVCLR